MVAFGASLALMLPVVSFVGAVAPVGSVISASASDTYNDESDFTFSYDTENKTATLVKYVGTATDVVIPPTVQNGKFTVTTIGTKAFYDTSKTLTSIQIPETVTTIEDYAIGCYYDTWAEYSTDDIGKYTVNNDLRVTCVSSTNQDVLLEYASKDYMVNAFGIKTSDSDLAFSYDTVSKTATVINYSSTVTDVVIPETVNGYTVVGIGQKAFYATSRNLTSITMPKNISIIGDYSIGCYYDTWAEYSTDDIGKYTINNDIQIYYYSEITEDALFTYLSKDYVTTAGGLKSPILLGSEDVTTTETDDPYANCIFDVNQDGDINSVDLLLLKKKILQMI